MSCVPRVLYSTTTDPWFNLATEDWVFRECAGYGHVLFLWRNAPTVVIGRHQNPWVECDLKQMESDGVLLARRQSGGGAVYHDLGNTNFTFLSPTATYSRDANFQIVLAALRSMGISAVRSGRNDILVPTTAGERKVSGNAFKHTRLRSFHHGTLLLDADLGRLERYLTPASRRYRARGTRSVSSPVVNLRSVAPDPALLSHERVCDALAVAFFTNHRPSHHRPEDSTRPPVEYLDEKSLATIPALDRYYREIVAWEWRFGKTPRFAFEVKQGDLSIELTVLEGVIGDLVVDCDTLPDALEMELVRSLLGVRYEKSSINAAMSAVGTHFPEWERVLHQLEAAII